MESIARENRVMINISRGIAGQRAVIWFIQTV